MRLILPLIFLPLPVLAQDTDEPPSLMELGAEMFMEGLMEEMAPALDEFQNFAEEIAPAFQGMSKEMGAAFAQLFQQLDSISNYELPEVLPNGDIIIRRSPDAPPYVPPKGTDI
jgi:hypothetical protein